MGATFPYGLGAQGPFTLINLKTAASIRISDQSPPTGQVHTPQSKGSSLEAPGCHPALQPSSSSTPLGKGSRGQHDGLDTPALSGISRMSVLSPGEQIYVHFCPQVMWAGAPTPFSPQHPLHTSFSSPAMFPGHCDLLPKCLQKWQTVQPTQDTTLPSSSLEPPFHSPRVGASRDNCQEP